MSGTPLLTRSTHETLRSDSYLWATGNTLGALGCTAAGVILGVRNGFKALPVSLFAMAGICGLNAAKGWWYDVHRERIRIQTQSERAESGGTYLQALEKIAGSLESKTSINDDDPVFTNPRATGVWGRIKKSLPPLFAPPPASGPSEAGIRGRTDAAVIRALQGVIDQLSPLFPDRTFSGNSPSETLTAMIAAIKTEVQKPKLGDVGDQLAGARKSLIEKDTRLAEQESALLKERQTVGQLQQDLASEKESSQVLQQENATVLASVAALQGQLSAKNSSEEQNAALRDDLQAAQEKASALETQKHESDATIARLNDELQSAQSALEAAKTAYVAALTAQQKTQEQLEAALTAQQQTHQEQLAAALAAQQQTHQKQLAAALAAQEKTHAAALAAATTRTETAEGQMSKLQQQVQSQKTDLQTAELTIKEINAWSPQLAGAMREAISRLQDPDQPQIYIFTPPSIDHPLYSLVVKVNTVIEYVNSINFETDSSFSLDASASSATPGSSPPSRRRISFGTPQSPGSRGLSAVFAKLPSEEEEDR